MSAACLAIAATAGDLAARPLGARGGATLAAPLTSVMKIEIGTGIALAPGAGILAVVAATVRA